MAAETSAGDGGRDGPALALRVRHERTALGRLGGRLARLDSRGGVDRGPGVRPCDSVEGRDGDDLRGTADPDGVDPARRSPPPRV